MSAQTLPPTKVLSSRPVSQDEAHSFLTNFITTSDAARLALSQDLGLNDQRRIAQALEGIYVPMPVEEPPKAAEEEPVQEDHEMGEAGEEGAEEEEGDTTVQETGEGSKVIDKEKRKADKKARKKQEQKERAEQKARENAA